VKTRPGLEPDRQTPVLLVKVGRYPLGYGPLGAARSLGRLGVPVHAMVEDRLTPTALSRYVTRAFVRPTTGCEPAGHLVETVREVGREIVRDTCRRCVALPTDNEAAVLLAEHSDELAADFLLPPVPAHLPRRLADKGTMYEICEEHRVPTPRTAVPNSQDDLLWAARSCHYPLVVKNLEVFTRLSRPRVAHTTLVRDEGGTARLLPAGRTGGVGCAGRPTRPARPGVPGRGAHRGMDDAAVLRPGR
jgi:predicted ATP-grasp superfamily ATP-dependent carboligase